jgi:hypothetical protein
VTLIDRKGLIERINGGAIDARLEIGCGPTPHRPGYITVDLLELDCVEIQGNVFELFERLNPGTVSAVYASHFIEHVSDLAQLMDGLARVSRPGAVIEFVVPHFSSPFFYSDYTHKTFFGLYTFSYLAHNRCGLRREVPLYGHDPKFDLVGVDLKFKSYRPNYIRHGVKKLYEKLVNVSNWTKELYEEMFTWIFPCYEIHFRLVRTDDGLAGQVGAQPVRESKGRDGG